MSYGFPPFFSPSPFLFLLLAFSRGQQAAAPTGVRKAKGPRICNCFFHRGDTDVLERLGWLVSCSRRVLPSCPPGSIPRLFGSVTVNSSSGFSFLLFSLTVFSFSWSHDQASRCPLLDIPFPSWAGHRRGIRRCICVQTDMSHFLLYDAGFIILLLLLIRRVRGLPRRYDNDDGIACFHLDGMDRGSSASPGFLGYVFFVVFIGRSGIKS
ncbi:hypothetical protein GGS23DRAFT_107060 [Durotheca rogersii]|uniref:uncharacterized protein n=1 Tax=Durotheca rogersii TaxID=419775 RepID=UPI00222003CF|nr:uncharacterized protein GGS23DRAFT_107060 [Durotheca rogersii]KAI5862129.1 hypothetical protein GGS23DRAFT_107060 [Durotheca rogersii]